MGTPLPTAALPGQRRPQRRKPKRRCPVPLGWPVLAPRLEAGELPSEGRVFPAPPLGARALP